MSRHRLWQHASPRRWRRRGSGGGGCRPKFARGECHYPPSIRPGIGGADFPRPMPLFLWMRTSRWLGLRRFVPSKPFPLVKFLPMPSIRLHCLCWPGRFSTTARKHGPLPFRWKIFSFGFGLSCRSEKALDAAVKAIERFTAGLAKIA